jgi:hypothetical protein
MPFFGDEKHKTSKKQGYYCLADNHVNVGNIYLMNVIYLEFYSIATRNNTHNQQDVLLIHHTIVLIVCTCIQRYIMYLKRQQLFYDQVSLGVVIR